MGTDSQAKLTVLPQVSLSALGLASRLPEGSQLLQPLPFPVHFPGLQRNLTVKADPRLRKGAGQEAGDACPASSGFPGRAQALTGRTDVGVSGILPSKHAADAGLTWTPVNPVSACRGPERCPARVLSAPAFLSLL